jgi:photosystem II stability/assembly factor-like uncharacterized protein
LDRVVFPGSFSPVGVAFKDVQFGFVVGSTDGVGGDVGVTRDGGTTWAWTRVAKSPITQVVVSGDDTWVLSPCPDDVRCASTLYRSRDLGSSWEQVTATGTGLVGVTTVSFAGEHGWAIGFGGGGKGTPPGATRLRQTPNGGRTWIDRPNPCDDPWPMLADVRFVTARQGWLLCSGPGSGTMAPAAVFESIDGGASWILRSANGAWGGPSAGKAPGGPVEGLAMSAGGRGWIWQGRSGTARTGDAGRTWTDGPPGKPEEIFVSRVSVLSDDAAFAIVSDGDRRVTGVIGTEDGGVTWHDVAVQRMDP